MDEAKRPEGSSAASVLPLLSKSISEGLAARDYLSSVAGSVLPGLSHSLAEGLRGREQLDSLATSVLPSVRKALGAVDSVSKSLEWSVMPVGVFKLPELDVTSGLISSVSKALQPPVIPASLFALPDLDVASGLISSVSKALQPPVIPASLFTLPEFQFGLDQRPPLATEVLEEQDAPTGSGMHHLDEDLWIALSSFPSPFQQMHWGAWEALVSGRPDSRRQSAHSARELIDWVLRTLAPDNVFSAEDVARRGHEGRPTRTMRAGWILRARGREFAKRIPGQLESVHGQLCGVAHTGRASVSYLRGLLRSTEGLLLALLNPPDE